MNVFKACKAKIPQIKQPVTLEIKNNARTVIYGPQKEALLQTIAHKNLRSGNGADTGSIMYPSFGKELWPSQAIHYMSFKQSSSSNAPFLGARYESFRDEFDASLLEYLKSKAPQNTSLNEINDIANKMNLSHLLSNWVVGLSNGQSRRAQLALALLRHPKFLVTDEPFLGLDVESRILFEDILSTKLQIPVVVGLRIGEKVPNWADQVLFADDDCVMEGPKAVEKAQKLPQNEPEQTKRIKAREEYLNKKKIPAVELRNITLKFKNATTPLFENFDFTAYEGERIHIKGPNGSGKSTLVALLTADHPQSWSQDVRLFGERREPVKHSYFSINAMIGHSSPEMHAIFPKYMNTKQSLSTAFSGFMHTIPKLTSEQEQKIIEISKKLNLDIESSTKFGDMPLNVQKLVLFGRALAKEPKILILDEAFSTFNDKELQLAFDCLDSFKGTVLVIAHVESEVPVCDSVLQLE